MQKHQLWRLGKETVERERFKWRSEQFNASRRNAYRMRSINNRHHGQSVTRLVQTQLEMGEERSIDDGGDWVRD